MNFEAPAWAKMENQKIEARGAGGYNDKDCFMRRTDQEGHVDFAKK